MSEKSQIHKGHRNRIKAKYLSDGIDSFNPHEALELMLYYAIPQRDTNPIAHRLLNAFGSISGVLDAPVTYLRKEGLSDNTIAFLKLIPDLTRIYINDKNKNHSKDIDKNKLDDYFSQRFIGRTEEVMILLLIDGRSREVFSGVISKGSINTTDAPIRKIAELALMYNATEAAIAHNHLNGLALPSKQDLDTTQKVYDVLKLINVRLIDHIIVADDDIVSLAESVYGAPVFAPIEGNGFRRVMDYNEYFSYELEEIN